MRIRFIIISIFISTFCPKVASQDTTLVYSNNIHWEYDFSSHGSYFRDHVYSIGDSVIDNKNYTVFGIDFYQYRLGDTELNNPSHDEALVLIDNDSIFLRTNDADSLVFTSNWKVNDTIVIQNDYPELDLILYKIDTTIIDGVKRRKWNFKNLYDEHAVDFTEGVGSNTNSICAPLQDHLYSYGRLMCCKHENTFLYDRDCMIITNSRNFISRESAIRIFPDQNCSNILNIYLPEDPQDNTCIKIYSIQGRVILSSRLLNRINRINFDVVNDHIILVKIFNSERIIKSEVVIF